MALGDQLKAQVQYKLRWRPVGKQVEFKWRWELPKFSPGGVQELQVEPRKRPKGIQEAPNCTQEAPQSAKLCSKDPQDVPSCFQAPKRLQMKPKRRLRRPEELSKRNRAPQMSILPKLFFFIRFFLVFAGSPPSGTALWRSLGRQVESKRRQVGPKKRQVEPKSHTKRAGQAQLGSFGSTGRAQERSKTVKQAS